MNNKILDVIKSYDHPLDLAPSEIRAVLDELDSLTHRQIRNAFSVLLDKYDSLQKGYRISFGINSAKMDSLKEQLKKLGTEQKNETIREMINLLEEEGYKVSKNDRPAIRIFNDELPGALQNKIRDEKLSYEGRLSMIMEILQKNS